MKTDHIPVIVVSYNSPDLIQILLKSFRQYYANPVYIIDGSALDIVGDILATTQEYADVHFVPFGYNIHHGPGMAWAIRNLGLQGVALFLDSDVEVIHPGMIEDMLTYLTPESYGVGWLTQPALTDGSIQPSRFPYLSPMCMLCNLAVMRQWPMPIKHGAPMITPMLALAQAGKSDLLRHIAWIEEDCHNESTKKYIRHDWQGTVRRTSGYHYDKAPLVEDYFDPELLALIPRNARSIVEFGCRGGSLARAYKKINPACEWTGVESDAKLIEVARLPCDFVFELNANDLNEAFFQHAAASDCWIFSVPMESLADPWDLLSRISGLMPAHACLLATFANMQHWSVQVRLNQGLLDHEARSAHQSAKWWFTRETMLSLFQRSGLQVTSGSLKRGNDDGSRYMPVIREMAILAGANPDVAVQDAMAVQYLVCANTLQGNAL